MTGSFEVGEGTQCNIYTHTKKNDRETSIIIRKAGEMTKDCS